MIFNTIPYVNYEIPEKTERYYYYLGYRFKYIPFILGKDIANVASHWKATGKPGGFIGVSNAFNIKYKAFLYSIPFNLYDETSPYKLAVSIIKDLSSKYDFRSMESAIINKLETYEFIETENNHNPLINLDNFNYEVKSLVNIDENENISLNIINLLKETEDFDNLFSFQESVQLSKMRAYSQIKSISKYKLKLPSFQYKYPLKNYNIKQGSPKEIVIFRDVSRSAKILENSFKSLLLSFINNYKGKVITIHEFTNRIRDTYRLNSIEDIKEYYNKDTDYYFSKLKFLPNFIKEYSECYIITSGVTDKYPRLLNCVVNGISKGGNSELERLCNNTKGKYVII